MSFFDKLVCSKLSKGIMSKIDIFWGVFENIDIKNVLSILDMDFVELPLRDLQKELML